MDIFAFNSLVSTENAARRYLLGFCWKNHQRFCPRCRERHLYKVQGGRRRCARCHYTFHDFSRRFLQGCGFTAREWLWFLKLFELDVPIREAAVQLGVSYATALKARDTVQRAILAQAVDARAHYALARPGAEGDGPGAGEPPTPVFGVMDLDGYILCDLLPDLTPETLLHFKRSFCLKTASVGRVVYTAPYRKYRMLVACGPRLWPTRAVRHDDAGIPADNGGFWPYAKDRLRRLRGVTPARFPLYLKEWELRYNQREGDLLPVLAAALCALVPEEADPRPVAAGRSQGPGG